MAATAKRTTVGVAGLSLWVAGKPISVNSAYGTRSRGGRYLRPEAAAWRDSVWAAFVPHRGAFTAAHLPLRVRCTFYGVRADADNLLKMTLDGLKMALGVDDRHMTPITAHVERGRTLGQGARIEVWAAERKGEAA